jgi:TonB family protein
MTALFIYAIESSICLALLWAFYEVALKNDTNHRRNRYYLMGSVLFSVVTPLVTVSTPSYPSILPGEGIASLLLPGPVVTPSGQQGQISWIISSLSLVYFTGMVISAVVYFLTVAGLLKMALTGRREGRIIYCDTERPVCFSAFGYIFISNMISPGDSERMVDHERNHISRLHHLDLVITVAIGIIQWFNPAAHLFRRSLQALHEYEADNACLENGEEPLAYGKLLVSSAFGGITPALSNTFSKKSLLKNRIIMMTRQKSGSRTSLKLLLALPVAALLFFTFSCNQVKKEAEPEKLDPTVGVYDSLLKDNVFRVVDQQPIFMDDPSSQKFMEWVYSNVKYPEEAKKLGVQGRVVIRFIVDENGKVIQPEVLKSDNPLLDEAALKSFDGCPDWAPGRYKGKPVKVYFTMPITFKLN